MIVEFEKDCVGFVLVMTAEHPPEIDLLGRIMYSCEVIDSTQDFSTGDVSQLWVRIEPATNVTDYEPDDGVKTTETTDDLERELISERINRLTKKRRLSVPDAPSEKVRARRDGRL